MAYDLGMADQMRADLLDLGAAPDALTDRKMFGGVCFMHHGNMICGVGKTGAMVRPGKSSEAAAHALPGVTAMDMGGRRMGGFVRMSDDAFADDKTRGALLAMALAHVQSLPPKAKG